MLNFTNLHAHLQLFHRIGGDNVFRALSIKALELTAKITKFFYCPSSSKTVRNL